MSETASVMIPLGTRAREFNLLDTQSGKMRSLSELKSNKGTVIMFICNHCPYVKHILKPLIEMARDYQSKGISFIAISSNDANYRAEDGPDYMKQLADEAHFPFPYLYDETQKTARDYQAACTPDFFVYDKDLMCVYRGRFDDSTPGNGKPVTGNDLRATLDCLIDGKMINEDQKHSLGCNIKWKK